MAARKYNINASFKSGPTMRGSLTPTKSETTTNAKYALTDFISGYLNIKSTLNEEKQTNSKLRSMPGQNTALDKTPQDKMVGSKNNTQQNSLEEKQDQRSDNCPSRQ